MIRIALPPTATAGERFAYVALRVFAGLVCVFLVAPILAIVPLSFNSGSFLHYPLPGLQPALVRGFLRLAVLAAGGVEQLHRRRSRRRSSPPCSARSRRWAVAHHVSAASAVLAILVAPMVVPDIIMAVGVYFAFAPLGLTDSYLGLILAHTALGRALRVITVLATLSGFDRNALRAAAASAPAR